ncbi:MAG: hypothetical protein CL915_01680 [Deltaproteobacteria bacterium]|nr:hypothetical protein [Deltaproteobacteria bacterium]
MKLQRVPVGLPEISALQLRQEHLSWVRTQSSEWGLLRKENQSLYRGKAYDAEVFAVVRTVMKENDIEYVGFVGNQQITVGSDLLMTKLEVEQSFSA